MVFTSFCWHHLVTGLLLRGVRLDDVWRESQNEIDFVREVRFRDEDVIPWSQQRFILTLRGETAVSDSLFNEHRILKRLLFSCRLGLRPKSYRLGPKSNGIQVRRELRCTFEKRPIKDA